MFKKIVALVFAFYAAVSMAAVDANKATAAELDSVKGIGPGISAKIVEERKKGNFKDWADLVARVNGIGDTKAAALSTAGLTVSGAAYKGAPAAKPEAKKEDKPAAKKDEKAAAKPDDKKDAKPAAAPASAAKAEVKKDDKKDAKPEAKKDDKKADEKKADAKKDDKKADAKKDDKKAEAAKPAASAKK